MRKSITSAKNFVRRNQTSILICITIVSTTTAVLNQIGLKQHNDFLKEHDLYETYYTLDEE